MRAGWRPNRTTSFSTPPPTGVTWYGRPSQSGRGEEVDTFETISEKTALAERFGLRIPYMTMNKREYLALIDHLAGLYQVEMDREFLHARAMEWEIRHAGRTPRVARQFIASLTG